MKIGIRTPSINKRISARTTGRIKREIKSSINPLYGKKGMGYINNPKKAIYNKVYNKTTTSIDSILSSGNNASNAFDYSSLSNAKNSTRKSRNAIITYSILVCFCIFIACCGSFFFGILTVAMLIFLMTSISSYKANKNIVKSLEYKRQKYEKDMEDKKNKYRGVY